MVKDYKTHFSLNANLSLRFIKRQANIVTHIVVRAVCYNASPSYWLEAPPFIVEVLIINTKVLLKKGILLLILNLMKVLFFTWNNVIKMLYC